MRKTLTIVQVLCFIALLALVFCAVGFRDRYGPAFWRAVSGGIQYTGGNVNITNGTLTASGALTVGSIDGETITDDTIDDDSIDFSDVNQVDFESQDSTNILLETEIDASSELLAIMDDETGSGLLVFGTVPTISNPTISGHARVSVTSGITASTTQSQGQGALTTQVNEISTVANKDDTITLPPVVIGIKTEIINNGVNTLLIFPASGDDLGLGTDNAEELEANERVEFVAYDANNWAKESTTEIIHAEIHDEDNDDAFVINDTGADFHSYHTNGLASGDLADWAFDAGGAGTSHAIMSIIDGTPSGTDIAISTSTSHGLAVGDIISQTNLADANYVGVFEVKDITSANIYEVAAVYTATGTGTMDQAATLEADAVAAGVYFLTYYISATTSTSNETFDFQLYNNATAITGSKVRRKFGTNGDFGSSPGGAVASVTNGDKISFALSNEDSSANITIRNLTIVLIRL